jgi:SET domain-containing protein
MSSSKQSSILPEQVSTVHQTELVVFKNSAIHGTGGFARCDILSGNALMEYVGEKIDKQESIRRCEANNVFIFFLNENQDIDGNVSWNPARWLNHSCSPNAEAELANDRIWLLAKRDIESGEEITFNYGFDLENYREYPCRCGAPNCVEFMVAEEFFDQVRTATALREEAWRRSA